jgi:polyphosphate kinase 2
MSVDVPKDVYEDQLKSYNLELVKFQEWVKAKKLKVLVIFEGRDAAGKGGTIKALTAPLNPRSARVVALPAPTEREQTQWYFQRYVGHLPAGGEIVVFDRSWYNRSGVERVMGFCTEEEYQEFARSVSEFERMLVRSGILILKYWLSVSDEEQEKRFQERLDDPAKRWKLSPMDLSARTRWVDYSKAKDAMLSFSHIPEAPWYEVPSDLKRAAHLNVLHHFLSQVAYKDLTPEPLKLPKRQVAKDYVRPPLSSLNFIPQLWPKVEGEPSPVVKAKKKKKKESRKKEV